MDQLTFWKDWDPLHQILFKIAGAFLLLLAATFLIVEWGELSPLYYWKITGYLENISFPVFSDHSNYIESTITADLPVVFQKLFGGFKPLPAIYSHVYLIFIYIGLLCLLTITTFLEKFWFYLGMGFWMLVIITSGIGKLGFFGMQNEMAIGLIAILYLSVAYYFNSINESVSPGQRFATFLGVFGLTALLIHFGSSYDQPLLFFTRFSYLPAFLICLVFILIIGHEIVFGILMLTTPHSNSSTGNFNHFTILSSVYLLNLLVLYLHRIEYLDWNIYYLNEYFLLGLSSIIGIWGLKSREKRYSGILPFYPYTSLLYFGMALVTFATLIYQSWHANDPFVESIRNLILYSHLGFGSLFFFYVISNFITQLKQNLPVHKFVFEEQNFPYITSKIAGMIFVAALFFKANYASMYLSFAGYYNGLGDLNLLLGKQEVATHFYKASISRSTNNHHANYLLAQLDERTSYRLTYLKNALKKKPTPYAYATLGHEFENGNQFFDALFNYQEGLRKFPGHWALQNNLALLYNKTSVADSAIYYLDQSNPGSWKEAVVKANRAAVSARHGLRLPENEIDDQSRFDLQGNLLASKLIAGDTSSLAFITEPKSITLNLFTYSYLKNLGLYCYKNRLPWYLDIVDPYLISQDNMAYYGDLLFIKALNLFQSGKVSSAIEIIYQLKESSEDESGKWESLLGKWSLALNAPAQAAKYFESAREAGYPAVSADLAQSYDQIGDKSLALFLIDKERQASDSVGQSQTSEWAKLFDAMEQGMVRWKSYPFTTEQQLLANAKKNEGAADSTTYSRLGFENPFFVDGVIAAAEYFHKKAKDEETAYRILHQAITFNTHSERLLKAYIDHCLNVGLIDFSDDGLGKLEDLLSNDEYSEYLRTYNKRKESAQNDLNNNW